MKRIEIEIEGKTEWLWAEKIRGETWFHYKGETHLYAPKEKRRGASASAGGDLILAPMPGKIVRVNFKVGDVVKKGDVVLVMEAMKMEYSLKAEVDGKVEKLNAELGTQVSRDGELVKIDISQKS